MPARRMRWGTRRPLEAQTVFPDPMANQKIIQCVGTSEEDTAHLRLLLRVARDELKDSWSWGTEAKANLVIVDAIRLIGEAAMRRATQRNIFCALIINETDPKPSEGLYLRRPLA